MNLALLQAPPTTDLSLFLDRGGLVMWLLAGVSVVIWTCLLEHRWYLRRILPRLRRRSRALAARDPSDWSDALRSMTLSRGARRLRRTLPLVRTLVVICPLLGLLGTVSGMIEVFDTMALLGSSDPKALSAGISRAVLTTMAGLVVALPAMYMVSRTERRIIQIEHRLYLDSIPDGSTT